MLFDAVAKRPFICQSIKVTQTFLPPEKDKDANKQRNKTKKNKHNIVTTVQSLFVIFGASLGPPFSSRVT